MKEFDTRIIPALGAGLLLGIVADLLLRTTPWGVNVPICMIIFIALAVILEYRHNFGLPPGIAWLIPAACFFSGAFAWRDSDALKFANGFSVCCLMALAAMRNRSGRFSTARVTEYSFGLIYEWLAAPCTWVRAAIPAMVRPGGIHMKYSGTVLAVIRGLAIAIPLALVFGILFISADESFEKLVNRLLAFDVTELTRMALWLPVFTLTGGGMLLRLLSQPEKADKGYEKRSLFLGVIETTIVLGLLNILFFSFIAAQLPYFFGGAGKLAEMPVLTMANYARRGFFELVAVSLLLLPLLLGIHWLSENDSERRTRPLTILSTLLVLMLFVVMASAMHRMHLYMETFGLTELRLYTSAFMLWLALVFAWFMKTVIFGSRERFAFGALVAGFMVVGMLNVINPDGLIARINLTRYSEKTPIDIQYLLSLSADAVPSLAAALPALDETTGRKVTLWIEGHLKEAESRDWRSWNWSAHGLRRSHRTR